VMDKQPQTSSMWHLGTQAILLQPLTQLPELILSLCQVGHPANPSEF